MKPEIVDKIEAEALEKFPVQSKEVNHGLRFKTIDENKSKRAAYIAGRSKSIEIEDALRELVRLKDIKDNLDKGISPGFEEYSAYKRDKEIAWQKAKELLK